MVWIASANGTGSSGQITFSSIPSTFTHLQVRIFARSTTTGYSTFPLFISSNLNGSANIWWHSLIGNGSTATSGNYQQAGAYLIDGPSATATANVYAGSVVDILDYANTNKNKTYRAISGYDGNGSGYARLTSYFEGSTNAINTIYVSDVSGANFTTGTRVDLYGITTSQVTGA